MKKNRKVYETQIARQFEAFCCQFFSTFLAAGDDSGLGNAAEAAP